MFRTLLLCAALALMAVPAAAQTAAPSPAPVTAAQFADRLRSSVGQSFEGGITLDAVSSEDNMLVITVGGPDGWRDGETRQTITDALIGGLCTSMPRIFDQGMTMRIDSIDDKVEWKGPVTKSCPATGQG